MTPPLHFTLLYIQHKEIRDSGWEGAGNWIESFISPPVLHKSGKPCMHMLYLLEEANMEPILDPLLQGRQT